MERIRYETNGDELVSCRLFKVEDKAFRVKLNPNGPSYKIVDIVTNEAVVEGLAPNMHSAKKQIRVALATLGIQLERETRKGKSSMPIT